MDLSFPSLDRAAAAAIEIAPDFRALVALGAASQAMLPTARLAMRPETGEAAHDDRIAALIAVFAPRRGEAWAAALLDGRFNPAVPSRDDAPSARQPW